MTGTKDFCENYRTRLAALASQHVPLSRGIWGAAGRRGLVPTSQLWHLLARQWPSEPRTYASAPRLLPGLPVLLASRGGGETDGCDGEFCVSTWPWCSDTWSDVILDVSVTVVWMRLTVKSVDISVKHIALNYMGGPCPISRRPD